MTTVSRTKRWHIELPESSVEAEKLAATLRISPLMAKLLLSAGIDSKESLDEYLSVDFDQLHDPFLMKNMDVAVDRLALAVNEREKIMVYGDYDVDGTTSVAMFFSFLFNRTETMYYIPDRYSEGYGFSQKGVEEAKISGCTLIVTLDCGIKDLDAVRLAKDYGIDVIVCDHHTPGDILPDAIVLDPKQKECDYPFKELSGCGVGFKLLQAMCTKMSWGSSELKDYLDFLAVSIAADIVPVTGENRILAQLGLLQMEQKMRPGFQALHNLSPRELPLKLSDLVFGFAPKINAAGRLDSGSKSVELMIAQNLADANKIASEINLFNEKRREIDVDTTHRALFLLENQQHFRHSSVVFESSWHKGVVGIVASRLIEHHYRPTIVLTESNGEATGSARSVEGFDLYEALNECSDLLTRFGGHYHAAGLTLPLENVGLLQEKFDQIASNRLSPLQKEERLTINYEIRFSDLFLPGESVKGLPRVYKLLEKLEPFGPGNDKPVFVVSSVYASDFRILKDLHLKISVYDPASKITLPAIGFNLAHLQDLVASGCAFDIAFTLESNTWNYQTNLQLQIRDIREHS